MCDNYKGKDYEKECMCVYVCVCVCVCVCITESLCPTAEKNTSIVHRLYLNEINLRKR